jgi:hypothetical protein
VCGAEVIILVSVAVTAAVVATASSIDDMLLCDSSERNCETAEVCVTFGSARGCRFSLDITVSKTSVALSHKKPRAVSEGGVDGLLIGLGLSRVVSSEFTDRTSCPFRSPDYSLSRTSANEGGSIGMLFWLECFPWNVSAAITVCPNHTSQILRRLPLKYYTLYGILVQGIRTADL